MFSLTFTQYSLFLSSTLFLQSLSFRPFLSLLSFPSQEYVCDKPGEFPSAFFTPLSLFLHPPPHIFSSSLHQTQVGPPHSNHSRKVQYYTGGLSLPVVTPILHFHTDPALLNSQHHILMCHSQLSGDFSAIHGLVETC